MALDRYNVGGYYSDNFEVLRNDLVADVVYLKTLNQMEFQDAVNMQDTDVLDMHLRFPADNTLATFEIAEGASPEYQRIKWFEKAFSLNKYRSKLMVDDEAKIRLDMASQWQYSIDGVSRGMARARDYNILNSLWKAAGIKTNAAAHWGSNNADLVGDIAGLIDSIFQKDNTNITEDEIRNITVYYPLKLWGSIRSPDMIVHPGSGGGNMGYMMMDNSQFGWAGSNYNVQFKGSVKLNKLNAALCVIKSPYTATHYNYTGGKIPTVEQVRDADEGADAWMVTQYYQTFVYPQSYEQRDTNDRIMVINGVSA